MAALILVALALFVLQLQWRKQAAAAAGARTQSAPTLRRLSNQQLRRATGRFEAESKLEQGGFGLLYSVTVYSVQSEVNEYSRFVLVLYLMYNTYQVRKGYRAASRLVPQANVLQSEKGPHEGDPAAGSQRIFLQI
jgi:hypothetical protein